MNQIRFIRAPKYALLSSTLEEAFQLSKEQSHFLIHIGAIYISEAPHPSLLEQSISTEPFHPPKSDEPKRTFLRLTQDEPLQAGVILRCHLLPRRFRIPENAASMIHFENEDFIILHKPAGLPSQMSLDNRIENVQFQLSSQRAEPIYLTHRLDIGTEGLLFIAKTEAAQKAFNGSLEAREVNKFYEALSTGPQLPKGFMTHWMKNQKRAPKVLAREEMPLWKVCQLEIIESSPFLTAQEPQLSEFQIDRVNRYRIRLITGRTHQIRAQLATEGNPLLGDTLYGGHPLPFQGYERQALKCVELEFELFNKHFKFTLPPLSLKNPLTP